MEKKKEEKEEVAAGRRMFEEDDIFLVRSTFSSQYIQFAVHSVRSTLILINITYVT